MSTEWELLFPTVHIHKKLREFSDHNPPFVFTQQSQHYKITRDFRFELTWLAHPDFLPRVKERSGWPLLEILEPWIEYYIS
jgi:hypothetical protein